MISAIKSMISFEVGRNPRVMPRPADPRAFLPSGVDGVIIFSADFELGWAWRYAKGLTDPRAESEAYARRARTNIPVILELCERHDMPITWATVGHLFLDHCTKSADGLAHPHLRRLPYFENKWWRYATGDWFEYDPCSSLQENDAWYAPDLVQQIIDSPVAHEIGCHTFSHIDCRDEVCPPAVMESELQASREAAGHFGLQLESFVFPGHTMGNFKTLRAQGYTSVRTNYINEIGYPHKDEHGLWRFPATAEIIMNPAWSEKYNLYRFRKIIDRTVKHRAVANLWFHPSLPPRTVPVLFETIFKHLHTYGRRVWVTTMREYTRWLEDKGA